MPINTDVRQAIVLALESEGADVATAVLDVLRSISREQDVLNNQWAEGSIGIKDYLAQQRSLIAEGNKYREVIREVRTQQDGFTKALEDTLVPINKLILDGLKLQTTLQDMAESSKKATDKVDVGLYQLIATSIKFGDKLRESVITLDQLGASAQKLRSDNIDRMADAAEKARRAFESTVIGTDQLAASAQKLKSDQIQAFYQNTDKLTKSLEDTLIPLNQVIMSGLKLQDAGKNAGGFATAADAAADKTKKFGYALLNVSHAAQDAQYGFGAVLNNIPLMVQSIVSANPKLEEMTKNFGGAAGIAGGAMLAGVAIDLLARRVGPVVGQIAKDWGLADDATKKFVASTEDAKVKLEALQSKVYKVQIDYDQIDQVERRLEKMQEHINAFNAGRKDNLTDEAARLTKEATHSYGGGTEAMYKAVAEGEQARGVSHADQNDIDKIKELQGRIEQGRRLQAAGMMSEAVTDAMADAEKQIPALKRKIAEANSNWAQEEVGAFQSGDFQAIQRMQNRARQNPGAFSRVGPGGVTAAEAIANLPTTSAEMLRRLDEDEDIKSLDDKMSEFKSRNRHATSTQAQAARKAAAEKKAADTLEGETEEAVRWAQGAGQRQAHDALGEKKKADAREATIAREEAARRRNAQRGGQAMRVGSLGAQFQQMTGIPDALVDDAGRMAAGFIDKGATQGQAFGATLKAILAQMRRIGQINAEQQAEILQFHGFAAEAEAIFAEVVAKIRGQGRNQARSQVRRRAFVPTFMGN